MLGYSDLADYLDNKANEPHDVIAIDLGIPYERVSALLRRRFPQGAPSPSKLSPKDRREIVNAVLIDGNSRAEMARRYGISSSTVTRVLKNHENRTKVDKRDIT